ATEGKRGFIHRIPQVTDRLRIAVQQQVAQDRPDDVNTGQSTAADAVTGQTDIRVHGDEDLAETRAPVGRCPRGDGLHCTDVADLHRRPLLSLDPYYRLGIDLTILI